MLSLILLFDLRYTKETSSFWCLSFVFSLTASYRCSKRQFFKVGIKKGNPVIYLGYACALSKDLYKPLAFEETTLIYESEVPQTDKKKKRSTRQVHKIQTFFEWLPLTGNKMPYCQQPLITIWPALCTFMNIKTHSKTIRSWRELFPCRDILIYSKKVIQISASYVPWPIMV